MDERKKGFNWRAFITLYIVVSGIFITLTGFVLYLSPAGRVAHWVEWRFIGLTKEGWQSVHTIFSFIFVVAAVLHLYFNWPIFWSYLKHRLHTGIRLKREIGSATVLTLAIFGLTLWSAPPFGWVMDLGHYLTESWSTEETEPPVPHAEELTLAEYAAAVEIETERAVDRLLAAGIEGVDTTLTMGTLAEMNDTTPKQLADLLAEIGSAPAGGAGRGAGAGYGSLTVRQVCEREGIELSVALDRLKAAGFSSDGSERLRDLAESQDRRAYELVAIMSEGS